MCTGKSFSEALILALVNPQYDKRLFTICFVQKLVFFLFLFGIQNNICRQHVVNLYFSGNSMSNLSSYCGLTESRMKVSDTDLPVHRYLYSINLIKYLFYRPLQSTHCLDLDLNNQKTRHNF